MDYEKHMQTNLEKVFSQRDPVLRLKAIREIYTETADLYEPHASAKGHNPINDAVTELLSHIPAEFTFTAARPALALNHIARLQWRLSGPDGTVVATGTDVAHFEDGKIRALYVFVDQEGS
ncbi:uncharacterized protein (UPF0297 family) [Rheinheimera pacifica]|uniref:nuclear transport factor 2 family protein n=1 Tax=Rheinheimera pacifica TaxID=173990 RepID=UPI00285EB750|nr:nuclear transport factor 2 family protein [Rheinheimera pacifica]MDR6983466.1 uncharacterized protein (UPF0297 family) [Rheinheimera pacifica]